ncbi:MAG: class I SAM-dependent methyltransferase [Elainella sp. Prado103]|jgi:ubiquinone/menaquinone biosynthesis C-methylase UbiE|nr:class I SAM-dependent methyltransferase [Elainella sp. Prado103]
MPTIEENLGMWSHYDWSQSGDEWSQCWGETTELWWGTIFPRIKDFVPAPTILEIAPGYGRFTDYLRFLCNQLIVVDLTPSCIEACRQRFSESRNIQFFNNDGKSLEMIEDQSIDFVFSFDSLVHVESDVLEAYLQQLSHKLKPNGIGFFHHSNIGEYVNPETGETEFLNVHWRAKTVTSQDFFDICKNAGLQCISQELVNWSWEHLSDCFSVFTPQGSKWIRPNTVVRNDQFMQEAARLVNLNKLYGLPGHKLNPEKLFRREQRLRRELQKSREELDVLRNRITAMETSKFWKLRKMWFYFKQSLKLIK